MSADNYYTVKQNPDTSRWHAIHGFMSDLEDGYPTLAPPEDTGYDTLNEAYRVAVQGHAEYGVIVDGFPDIVTKEQLVRWAANLIARTAGEQCNGY